MVSYGWEDTEMCKRFARLGYHVCTISDHNLIHLDHRRGIDSRPNEHDDANRPEFEKVMQLRAFLSLPAAHVRGHGLVGFIRSRLGRA